MLCLSQAVLSNLLVLKYCSMLMTSFAMIDTSWLTNWCSVFQSKKEVKVTSFEISDIWRCVRYGLLRGLQLNAKLRTFVTNSEEMDFISSEFVTNVQAEEEAFCFRIVNSIWNLVPSFWTGDQKEICGMAQSSTPWKKSLEKSPSAGKVMITVFWSCDCFLWMQCWERRQSTLTPASGRWQTSGSVSYEFGLTNMWLKTCFILTMQGCTQVGRLGIPLQNLVRIVTPSTLQHRSSTLRFPPI